MINRGERDDYFYNRINTKEIRFLEIILNWTNIYAELQLIPRVLGSLQVFQWVEILFCEMFKLNLAYQKVISSKDS